VLGIVVLVVESARESLTPSSIAVDITSAVVVLVTESSADRTTVAEAIPTVASNAMAKSVGRRILLNMCPFLSVNDEGTVPHPPITMRQRTAKPRQSFRTHRAPVTRPAAG
jgi:hypothetical protein